MSTCRRCHAEIVWATTDTGRPMPLDPLPTTDGNLAVHRDLAGDLHARLLRTGQTPDPEEHRGTAHFATCPNWTR